jgi:hypothetical protein
LASARAWSSATQGLVGGMAFWLMGWHRVVGRGDGGLLADSGRGHRLVWMPAAIGLFVSGRIARGVCMLIVSALIISMVDNVLRRSS